MAGTYNPNVNITNLLSLRVFDNRRPAPGGGQTIPADPGPGGIVAYNLITAPASLMALEAKAEPQSVAPDLSQGTSVNLRLAGEGEVTVDPPIAPPDGSLWVMTVENTGEGTGTVKFSDKEGGFAVPADTKVSVGKDEVQIAFFLYNAEDHVHRLVTGFASPGPEPAMTAGDDEEKGKEPAPDEEEPKKKEPVESGEKSEQSQ